ncbi:Holliday junction resolvase RuvX [Hydromonas duriensis]|uniref:Putative pre-16S rRNA nuclease n=1 Tax=Hydromonas duriensis TaxID=1527608 RepID=A0A4R6Y673_9BURK|nr:Holliday junction resolvase RuvX [Hydromonas duriensis]TDR30826.1 putative Holliday junction resolvase [Hydromonas duriensis]
MSIQTYIGIDYGLKRVGVAVGNTLTRHAEPLSVLQRIDDAQVIRAIEKLMREWQVQQLFVGVPRHPDGTAHDMTATCLAFIEQLRNILQVPVAEVDERYSSAVLRPKTTRSSNGKIRAAVQDDQAAALILQQYLNEC